MSFTSSASVIKVMTGRCILLDIISLCQVLIGTKLHFKISFGFVIRPLLLFSRLPTLKVKMKYIIYIHFCPSLLKHCRQKYLEARKAQSVKYDLSTRSIPDQEIIPHCELSPSGRHYKRHCRWQQVHHANCV